MANSDSLQQIKVYHSKFKFTTTNLNWLRQVQIRHGKFKLTAANQKFTTKIQIRHGKFKFITANSNSLHQIKIHYGRFRFVTVISSLLLQTHHIKFKFTRTADIKGQRRSGLDIIFYLSTVKYYVKFASSENEFKDFSARTPLIHFVIQRWWAGIRTRRKIQVFSTPRVKFDCH